MKAVQEDEVACSWAPPGDRLYRVYHDTEWGVPVRDSRALWEKLQLEGMQAGLSWITVLRKRETLCEEFDGFDPELLARWDRQRIDSALCNPGIIRSRRKVEATVGNARGFLEIAEHGDDFSDWLWGYVGGGPIQSHLASWRDAPTQSEVSQRLSKDLKARSFSFCGPVIVYAFMQAVGMVNNHEIRCCRYRAVQELA